MTSEPLPKNFVIRALATDCQVQADEALGKLQEVLERLQKGDDLAAVGAAEGLTQLVQYVAVVLGRLAVLTRTE